MTIELFEAQSDALSPEVADADRTMAETSRRRASAGGEDRRGVSEVFPQAAFYSYAYPEPADFRASPIPKEATFAEALGEFVLPYSAVREAVDPDALLLAFLSSTYNAAAKLGSWNRTALECPLGVPGIPRRV